MYDLVLIGAIPHLPIKEYNLLKSSLYWIWEIFPELIYFEHFSYFEFRFKTIVYIFGIHY